MKGKKAQKSEPITEGFIGPGLAIVALVVIFFAGTKLYAALAPIDKSVGTLNNFDVLVGQINTLLEDKNKFVATSPTEPLDLSVGKTFVLVGFNKDDKVEDACQYETATKPLPDCVKGKACLCAYKDTAQGFFLGITLKKKDNDFDKRKNNYPIQCQPLDVDYIFTLEYTPDKTKTEEKQVKYLEGIPEEQKKRIYKNLIGWNFNPNHPDYPENYAYFFLYGQCEDWSKDKDFDSGKLYLEIFRDKDATGKDTTYLFIAAQTPETDERYEEMIKKYPPRLSEYRYINKIEAAIKEKDNKIIIEQYEAMKILYPNSDEKLSSETMFMIGYAYQQENNTDTALAIYEKSSIKEQDKAKKIGIHFQIATLYEELGEKDKALTEYKKIIDNFDKEDNILLYTQAESKIQLLESSST